MLFRRNIIDEIEKYLQDTEILVLHGARQVGKTSIMLYLQEQLKQQNAIFFYHDLEDIRYLVEYNKDIDSILAFWKSLGLKEDQKTFIFIDEIQYLDNPSSFLKLVHDHFPFVKLIVSGSSSFEIKSKFKDSLVGRIVNFEIFGLSFAEYLQFKNIQLSLTERSDFAINNLQRHWKEFTMFGTYPRIVLEDNIEKKDRLLKQILQSYVQKDIAALAKIQNIQKFNHLVRLLAEQSGELLNISEIAHSLGMAENTVNEYLFILENTYIIRRVYPFHHNLRSELTKMPKIYFEDSGLMNLLRHNQLLDIFDGKLLETAVFGELRKKHSPHLYFWRTNTQKEIDFVIDHNGLRAIEVKQVFCGKKDVNHLMYFAEKYPEAQIEVCALEQKALFDAVKSFYPWEL